MKQMPGKQPDIFFLVHGCFFFFWKQYNCKFLLKIRHPPCAKSSLVSRQKTMPSKRQRKRCPWSSSSAIWQRHELSAASPHQRAGSRSNARGVLLLRAGDRRGNSEQHPDYEKTHLDTENGCASSLTAELTSSLGHFQPAEDRSCAWVGEEDGRGSRRQAADWVDIADLTNN